MKLITLLIPSYNEYEVLPFLIEKLDKVTGQIENYQFEYLFVNDGSTDQTLNYIKDQALEHSKISYVDLSRNYGKEIAMLAGMDHALGDAVIILDADLQHPPEKIKEMIYWWEQGYDDIYTVRENREEAGLTKYLSKFYYKILQRMTSNEIYPNAGDFRLLDRKCVDALTSMRESERYTKGLYAWMGFQKKQLSYHENERAAGETKWGFRKLLKLAIDGITSYSTVPLRMSSVLGFIISFVAFIFLIFEIINILIHGISVAGYGTLLVGVLFMGGIQLLSLGIIGEYLARVFNETKRRPPYFIREYETSSKKDSKPN